MTQTEKLRALCDAWPRDNGDPPDTDYQRGYMAACEANAATLRAILDEGEPDKAAAALAEPTLNKRRSFP